MVNYTQDARPRERTCCHGVKLTMLLTTLSMLFGLVLAYFPPWANFLAKPGNQQDMQRLRLLLPGNAASYTLFVVYFSIPEIFGFLVEGLVCARRPGSGL